MAFFRSVHCMFGHCERCLDGAALNCSHTCHLRGERTMRVCDYCGEKPATNKHHPAKFRLCSKCEHEVRVDETGKFWPRTFDQHIVMAAQDATR